MTPDITPDEVPVLLDLWREELCAVVASLRDEDELLCRVRRAEITIKVGITHNIDTGGLMSDVTVTSRAPKRDRAKGALHWGDDGSIVAGDEDTGQLDLIDGGRR